MVRLSDEARQLRERQGRVNVVSRSHTSTYDVRDDGFKESREGEIKSFHYMGAKQYVLCVIATTICRAPRVIH